LYTSFVFSQNNNQSFASIEDSNVITSEADKEFDTYLTLLEKHKQAQQELMDSANYFKKIRSTKYILNGKDINTINLSFSNRIKLLNQSLTFPTIDYKLIENNHLVNLISTHLKIAAFETYLLQQKILGQNAKVNNLINEENTLYRKEKNSLKKIKKNIISNKFRKSILETWDNSKGTIEEGFNEKKINTIVHKIIETSYYRNFLSNSKNNRKSKRYFRKLINEKSSFSTKVNFNNFMNNIFLGVSKFVGNFMGFFATRKGKLKNNVVFINNSLKLLQPLDVLLEKTPFRLTDKFIPGYWGHTAIYIGNEVQLRELGIWHHPIVSRYHDNINRGKVIVEALRSKVAFNTFKNFTNIDDYAQLRLNKEPALAKKREMIIRVFAQIGKKYDFGYDIESSKKIICSELHYITFDEVNFNTNRVLGINTLSVDKVAEQGLKHGAFYPIELYLDGIRIEEGRIFELYDQLPKARKKEIRKLKKSLH
jgi:uncharacterized protein (DUF2344 family)